MLNPALILAIRQIGCLSLLLFSSCLMAQELYAGRDLTGGLFLYYVKAGDSLTSVGARFGMETKLLAQMNDLPAYASLKPGQTLEVDNRHIAPAVIDDGIVINLPQRMLFRSVGGKIQSAYPVALGKPDWPTPKGKFVILTREKDKTWLVPPSIQQEMLLEGKEVLERVPPGPDNPLGRYWLGLSLPGIGIHGTLAPQSIYRFASHGCIRLHPDDVEQLYRVVEKDEAGSLIYQPVLLFEAVDGRIFLEVHRDIYKKGVDANRMARELADAAAVTSRVDWGRAASVIAAHEGLARDVTMDANREMP